MCNIKHGCVVLVDEHHHLPSRLSVGGVYEVYQAVVGTFGRMGYAPFLFQFPEAVAEIVFQLFPLHVLSAAHVEV